MCYHISFEVKLESLQDIFPELVVDTQLELDFQNDSYINGFDHRPHTVMYRNDDGMLQLEQMIWGFLPLGIKNMADAQKFWNGYKDETGKWRTGFMTLSSTGEEILQKKLYREAALNRRCLVFADGFFEWHHYFPMGKKGQQLKTATKYPYHIQLKDNPYPFMMLAGIWNPWSFTEVDTATGEMQLHTTSTFSVLTTAANELMGNIHNSKKRMPVIFPMEEGARWLDQDLDEEQIQQLATFQFPSTQMQAYTISKDFQQTGFAKQPHEYPEFKPEFC